MRAGTLPQPGDALPELVSFEDLEKRFADLAPADRLGAFQALPPDVQAQAWLELRMRLDAFRDDDAEDELAVAA